MFSYINVKVTCPHCHKEFLHKILCVNPKFRGKNMTSMHRIQCKYCQISHDFDYKIEENKKGHSIQGRFRTLEGVWCQEEYANFTAR